MPAFRPSARLLYGLLAVCLLVLAQNAAALHPGEHDDGIARSATCGACLVINLLSSACVDTTFADDPEPLVSGVDSINHALPTPVEALAPRQRAPPRS